MNHAFALTRIKTSLLSLLFMIMLTFTEANAQTYWDKIPALTSQCYGEKDDFASKIQQLKSQVKDQLEKSKRAAEDRANKMTNEEKMALATKYQNMKPEEIIKMQNEMMEMQQAQVDFQQKASAFETSFSQLESDFRTEFGKRLGPIEQEYNKLPDGEGTPEWAIKKGEELMASYKKEYESICAKYFTASDAKFKTWLKGYQNFLIQHEVPFNQKSLKAQYAQIGLTPDESVASLMALEKYLDKCHLIFGLRRPYPQG